MTGYARFKELCMDVNGGAELGRFWADAVGARFETSGEEGEPDEADVGNVVGDAEYQGIAMCPVPEPKTVKHRVHLDVYGDPVDLAARGAEIVLPAEESGFGWTTMRDPEGGDFCAFRWKAERGPEPSYKLHGIAVDCSEPEQVARWWGEAYGVEPTRNESDHEVWWTLEHVTQDPVLTFDFVQVPEPKTVKNRIHWDVYGDVDDFLTRGATRLWEMPRWTVLADPEGNEFCVFAGS